MQIAAPHLHLRERIAELKRQIGELEGRTPTWRTRDRLAQLYRQLADAHADIAAADKVEKGRCD